MNSYVRNLIAVAAPSFLLLGYACGGTVSSTPGAGDAGVDAADLDTAMPDQPDASVPDSSEVYPAPHTPMPLVDNNGGRVIEHVKVVTVTWTGDDTTLVPRLQQFDDTITSTPYWSTATSEYCQKGTTNCIGPGTAGEHVVVTTPPPGSGFTDSSMGAGSTIQTWLQNEVTTDTNMPDPTADTIYAIYLPAGVDVVLDGGKSCQGFLAYHNTMDVTGKADGGGPVTVAYAVIPRCGSSEASATVSASHEFAEAVTDPDIGENNLTFYMYNTVWAPTGGEVGDLCESGNSAWSESSFTVQRIWSNKSAKASHDPCVPIPAGEVYFNAAPRKQTFVLAKVGDMVTIPIDAYSDAPMANWTLSASTRGGGTPVGFKFDNTSVNNGSLVNLTITLNQVLAQATTIRVTSTSSTNVRHSWSIQALP
jgi:hypothetical protein